jgi:hypothetical protein
VGEPTNKYIARGSNQTAVVVALVSMAEDATVCLAVHTTTQYHEIKNRLGTLYDVPLSFELLILYGKVNMGPRLQCTPSPRDLHRLITSERVGAL